MLQELAAQTGASGWVIGSLLFFVAAWAVIAWRVYRAARGSGRPGTPRPRGRRRRQAGKSAATRTDR